MESSSEACLQMESVTESRGTWEEAERKNSGGMRLEWKRTARQYATAVNAWQELSRFSELSIAALVVPHLRRGSTGAAGNSWRAVRP